MRSRETNKLIVVGNVMPAINSKIHQRNWIYDEEGISPAQTSTQFKDPIRVLVRMPNEDEQ